MSDTSNTARPGEPGASGQFDPVGPERSLARLDALWESYEARDVASVVLWRRLFGAMANRGPGGLPRGEILKIGERAALFAMGSARKQVLFLLADPIAERGAVEKELAAALAHPQRGGLFVVLVGGTADQKPRCWPNKRRARPNCVTWGSSI